MFDFQPNPTFSWPVKVLTPQSDGSQKEEGFTATWETQNTKELNVFQAAHPRGFAVALIEKALKGFEGINAGGSPMAFTPENVALLAETPHVQAALVASYWDAVNGKLREKN